MRRYIAFVCSALLLVAGLCSLAFVNDALGFARTEEGKQVDPEYLARAWAYKGTELAKELKEKLTYLPDYPGKAKFTLAAQAMALSFKMGSLKTVEEVAAKNAELSGLFKHIGVSQGKLNLLLGTAKTLEKAGEAAIAIQTILSMVDPLIQGDYAETGRKAATAFGNTVVYNAEFRAMFDSVTKGKATESISAAVKGKLGDGRLGKFLTFEIGNAGNLDSGFFKHVPVEDAVAMAALLYAGDYEGAGTQAAKTGLTAALKAGGVPGPGWIIAAYQVMKMSSEALDKEEYLFKKDMTQYTIYEKDDKLRNHEIPTADKVDYFINKYMLQTVSEGGTESAEDWKGSYSLRMEPELMRLIQKYAKEEGGVDLPSTTTPSKWVDQKTGEVKNRVRTAVLNLLRDYEVVVGARDTLREAAVMSAFAKGFAKKLPEVAALGKYMQEGNKRFEDFLKWQLKDLAEAVDEEDKADVEKFIQMEINRHLENGVLLKEDAEEATKQVAIVSAKWKPMEEGDEKNLEMKTKYSFDFNPKKLNGYDMQDKESQVNGRVMQLRAKEKQLQDAVAKAPAQLETSLRETIKRYNDMAGPGYPVDTFNRDKEIASLKQGYEKSMESLKRALSAWQGEIRYTAGLGTNANLLASDLSRAVDYGKLVKKYTKFIDGQWVQQQFSEGDALLAEFWNRPISVNGLAEPGILKDGVRTVPAKIAFVRARQALVDEFQEKFNAMEKKREKYPRTQLPTYEFKLGELMKSL